MSKKYDYKDQELDLKMRIKFLQKKLREPDHGVEQYEEWQSNLEMVTDELTKLQVKKFKYFLGKWVHNFKESNQLINVTDCMFASLEEEDQKDVAIKWYHRVVKEKDIKHYQVLAQYTKEENQMLKNREKKALKAQKQQYKKQLSKQKEQNKQAIKQSKESIKRHQDHLYKQYVSQLERYRDHLGQLEEKNKTLNLRIDELEDQKWKLNKIVGKYQQEVKQ